MDTNQQLLNKFITEHPLQAAIALEKMRDDVVVAFLNQLSVSLAVRLINSMHSYKVATYLELIELQPAIQLIEQINLDAAELALRQCSDSLRQKILSNLSLERSELLKFKLSYAVNSVGALMIPTILALRKELTVKEAITIGKKEKNRPFSQIYIVDEDGKLEGFVKLDDLLFANDTDQLDSIMISDVPKLLPDTEIESIIDHQAWVEFKYIPVVDSSDKLIGNLSFEVTQKNKKKTGMELTKDIVDTSNALGELFRIGLTGFFQSIGK